MLVFNQSTTHLMGNPWLRMLIVGSRIKLSIENYANQREEFIYCQHDRNLSVLLLPLDWETALRFPWSLLRG
jgi:hypothetical protein